MPKFYSNHRTNAFKRLIRIDSIRMLKLTEMTQYSILTFLFGFFFGELINTLSPNVDYEKISYKYLCGLSIWHFILISVSTYYVFKIIYVFPFMFGFLNKKYVPNAKMEAYIGATIGLAIIFDITQSKFNRLISELRKRSLAYVKIDH